MIKLITLHLGLGDAIICAGLVSKLAEKQKVIVPCYNHNFESVNSLFSETKNIIIQMVNNDADIIELSKEIPTIKIGQFKESMDGYDFPSKFYEDAEVDYNERYLFNIPKTFTSELRLKKFLLLLNKSSLGIHKLKGLDITQNVFVKKESNSNLVVYEPYPAHTILTYVEHIRKATEIHCVDTAFLHLVEQSPTIGKLFYHKYARPNSFDFKFRKDWTIYS